MVLVIPLPVTVITPARSVAPVFAVTFSVIVPSPVPLEGDTVNHDGESLDTDQDAFDVTVNVVLSADDPGAQDMGETSRICFVWVTVMVLVIPLPSTVIVPVRSDAPVFAVTFSVIVSSPVPLEGVTVSQEAALLDAVQDTFDVTAMVVLSAADPVFQAVGATTRFDGAAWVTAMVLVIPLPTTVIVPVRSVVPVFSDTTNETEPLPVPSDGVAISQEAASLDTVQDIFEETVTTGQTPAEAPVFHVSGETYRLGTNSAAWVTAIVLVMPPPATVTVPVLLLVPVFCVTASPRMPFPVPLDPPATSTISHEALLDTVQATLDVTFAVVAAAAAPGFHSSGATTRTGGVSAAWVTAIVLVMPPPVTVIVPVLLLVPVFCVTASPRIPSPVPLFPPIILAVNQVALLDTVQDTFEVTYAVPAVAAAPGFHSAGVTTRFGGVVPGPCVTVTILVSPPPSTVIVPVRLAAILFWVTCNTNIPLPVPSVPCAIKTDSQLGSLLLIVQDTFDVTLTGVIVIAEPVFHVNGETSSLVSKAAAAWVTVIVLLIPPPDTVTVPVLTLVTGFALAFSVIVPLPVPSAGVTVSHASALLVAVQENTFDVTVTVVLPADEPVFQVVGDTVRVDSDP